MQRPVGTLQVTVLKAINLKKIHLLGTTDPYVKLNLTDSKYPPKKTDVKRNTLNPEWSEKFSLFVTDPDTQSLQFHLHNWEQIGLHEKMGMNVVPLRELSPDEPKVMTLDLLKNMDANDVRNQKSRGQLVVELTYKPLIDDEDMEGSSTSDKPLEGTPTGRGRLVVVVHEAQDVEGKNHTNPYALVLFRGQEKKTKRVNKSRDPRWGEEFQFVLDEPPSKEKLHVEVVSTSSMIGLLHPKECLGYVDISLEDVVTNRRINEKFHLVDSKNGQIRIELQWRT